MSNCKKLKYCSGDFFLAGLVFHGDVINLCSLLLIYFAFFTALLMAAALAFLPLKKLITLYLHMAGVLLVITAHYCSSVYVDDEKSSGYDGSVLENHDNLRRAGIHAAIQCILSALTAYMLKLTILARLVPLIYVVPVCARVAGYPISSLHRMHNFAFLFTMMLATFYLFNTIPKILDLMKAYMQEVSLRFQLHGWMPVIVTYWFEVSFSVQFLIFWSSLLFVQLCKHIDFQNYPTHIEDWLVIILTSMAGCVATPVSLLGVCISISYVAYGTLTLTKLFLQGRDALAQGNVLQRGLTEGFTMFLLAIQTGLLEMKTAHRAFLMSIVLFIVLSSLIQSMYEITEPVLLALGAAQNKSIWKHCRALLLSTFLWMFPLYMAFIICQFFDMDFWLMVVISSCVLTSVQVVGSLVTYGLFIYDALRQEAWESLDDVVFYTKSTTRVLEFIVAVFVVCYGVHESLFGEWSWVNGMILLIHCYVNVWQRLQTGWKSYLLRREAIKKIESLPSATTRQLEELNDICSICYQDMTNAKITACQHYFHGTCLKKWLYVTEKCPMCHQTVEYSQENQPETGSNEDHNQINEENTAQVDQRVDANVTHHGENTTSQPRDSGASETVQHEHTQFGQGDRWGTNSQ